MSRFPGVDFIDFDALLSAEERMVRDTVRAFVDDKVKPIIEECHRDGRTPLELVLKHVPGTRAPLAGRHPWHVLIEAAGEVDLVGALAVRGLVLHGDVLDGGERGLDASEHGRAARYVGPTSAPVGAGGRPGRTRPVGQTCLLLERMSDPDGSPVPPLVCSPLMPGIPGRMLKYQTATATGHSICVDRLPCGCRRRRRSEGAYHVDHGASFRTRI